jgi:hypothetical protein
VSSICEYCHKAVQTWLQKRRTKKRKKEKEKEKGKFLRTVIVRAIEAFEVKQGISMHARYQSDKQNTNNYCSHGGHYCVR